MPTSSRIIVRAPNWVGDAVMALPFLRSLRLNAPDANITVLARPTLGDFFAQVVEVTEIMLLDESSGRRGLVTVWKNANRIRGKKFDLAFCLPPSFGSALMMWLAGVDRRIGHAADRRGWLLTDSMPYLPNGKRPHRAESFLQLLTLVWDTPKSDRELCYNPGEQSERDANAVLSQRMPSTHHQILAIAPGAAQPNKIWPAARFAEVGQRWLEGSGRFVAVLGGEGDRRACDAVIRELDDTRVVDLCGVGGLPLVAALIKKSQAFVGNDSGLSHLAAAVGVPVVVISGPGDPSEVAPFNTTAITIKMPLFCSPCYSNRCFRTDHPLECLDLVSVETVWDSVNRLSLPSRSARLENNETHFE